jgi:FMN phosphatase YigB (HAD superfamily)
VTARFDAILIDAGGVVVIPDPNAIGDALDVPVTFSAGHHAHYRSLHALEMGAIRDGTPIERMSWAVYRASYAALVGFHDGEAAVERLGRIWSPLIWRRRIEESIAALWRLYQAGVPLGVVSNASGQIEGVLRYQGVCQVGEGAGVPVTVVVDSHVAGFAKPDPAVFGPALAALGNPDPSRVAYVGDSLLNDVFGAQAAGLVPLQLDPYELYAEGEHERISSLHALVDWV